MSDKQTLTVTSAKQLRAAREEGTVMPFPSGNAYRVRPPTTAGLLKRGDLPNVLLSFVVDVFHNGPSSTKVQAFLSPAEKRENTLDLLNSFRVVCEEMWMEPKIVANPQGDNEVAIDDIPAEDQLFAFQLTFLGVEGLRPFRGQPSIDVESVSGDESVPPPPQ